MGYGKSKVACERELANISRDGEAHFNDNEVKKDQQG